MAIRAPDGANKYMKKMTKKRVAAHHGLVGAGLEIGHIPIKRYFHRKYRQKFHFDL